MTFFTYFGNRYSFYVIAFVVLVSTTIVFGQVQNSVIVAQFKELKEGRENSDVTGTLYYLYNPSKPRSSRMRMIYNLPHDVQVTNFYHFDDEASYSMCTSSCATNHLSEYPDPWYFVSDYYTKTENTETNGEGTVFYWFERSDFLPETEDVNKTNRQISRILMGDSTTPSNKIWKIEFFDKRTLILSDVQLNPSTIAQDNEVFKDTFKQDASLGCKTPTCAIYADLVFVLDNSRSVEEYCTTRTDRKTGVVTKTCTKQEWTDTGNFVKAVIDSFEFGEHAVEAAIVEFNADTNQDSVINNAKYHNSNVCNRIFTDPPCFVVNGSQSINPPAPHTASIIQGSLIGNTLSGDKNLLKTIMDSERPAKGGTCQGYGLEVAMQLFDNSPRKDEDRKPDRIVIVVTDGEDKCPNRTAYYADKLKKKKSEGGYDAFVIEIGVGMSTSCDNYDMKFLKRLASKLVGTDTPAYYSVNDYTAVQTVADEFFKPLCESFSSECGPKCHGFCGCGKCFCPSCEDTGSTCDEYTCTEGTDGTSATGCEYHEIPCVGEEADEVCTFFQCDGEKTDEEGRCSTIIHNDCATSPLKEQYPDDDSQCYVIECDTGKGGCYPKPRDDWCQQKHGGTKCLVYKCDENATGALEDHCYVEKDSVGVRQTELNNQGWTCIEARCDLITGDAVDVDKCVEEGAFPNCYTYACGVNEEDGTIGCISTPIDHPDSTACGQYECTAAGWDLVEGSFKDEDVCKEEAIQAYLAEHTDKDRAFAESQFRCTNFDCDIVDGCKQEQIEGCFLECPDVTANSCSADTLASTNEQCVHKHCAQDEEDNWVCVVDSDEDCYTKLGAEAAEKNAKYPTKCYTPICQGGKCVLHDLGLPPTQKTACKKPVCVLDGKDWKWSETNTEEGDKCEQGFCHEGGCYEADSCVCDPVEGCKRKESCVSKDNECVTHTCDVDPSDGLQYCHEHPVQKKSTTCMEQVCEEGKLVWKYITGSCKTPESKCVSFLTCSYDDTHSECVYKNKTCPYGECDSPCYSYECNPETGHFDKTAICVDGLSCTIDQCDAYGKCSFRKTVNCYEEIDMSTYTCFTAKCREEPALEKGYRCTRKLVPNAFIDVCGNCIADNSGGNDDESGSTAQSSGSQNTLIECADAPAKPLFTEGLAAASIALIIVGAIIVGAAVTASGVVGTKVLLDRAKDANNQSAHSNPLFEGNEAELTNPGYAGQ